jgi:hypothetical protein
MLAPSGGTTTTVQRTKTGRKITIVRGTAVTGRTAIAAPVGDNDGGILVQVPPLQRVDYSRTSQNLANNSQYMMGEYLQQPKTLDRKTPGALPVLSRSLAPLQKPFKTSGEALQTSVEALQEAMAMTRPDSEVADYTDTPRYMSSLGRPESAESRASQIGRERRDERTMEALTKSFQSFEKGVTKQMGKVSKAATRAATATPGTGVRGSKPFKSMAQWNKLTPTEKDKIAKQYGIEGLKRKDQKSFFERMF